MFFFPNLFGQTNLFQRFINYSQNPFHFWLLVFPLIRQLFQLVSCPIRGVVFPKIAIRIRHMIIHNPLELRATPFSDNPKLHKFKCLMMFDVYRNPLPNFQLCWQNSHFCWPNSQLCRLNHVQHHHGSSFFLGFKHHVIMRCLKCLVGLGPSSVG